MPPISPSDAAIELLTRREARRCFAKYIGYTSPKFKHSAFSDAVSAAVDQFIEDVIAGKRPILILQAPPQHGKSEMISRKLPPYIMGRFPDLNIGAASYSDELAGTMAQAVRRNLVEPAHLRLFPVTEDAARRYTFNRIGEFSNPNGPGGYVGVGVGAGLTGRPVDIGLIDDPTKNEKEALSSTVKEGHWNWYQSVFSTRLSENSGQIIMATSWAEDDLPARIEAQFKGDPRLTVLRFPAINEPDEVGYNPELPRGALAPELKSLQFLREMKGLFSDYWWSAMYQQSPRALGGNVFKEFGARYYSRATLPTSFDEIICSWDMTFKDSDGSDFVVGQAWGKKGANAYLLDQIRDRLTFTQAKAAVVAMRDRFPQCSYVLIEDKANGPAIIDSLESVVPGLTPVEPDGSKVARAHAVTAYWEAGNVWIPLPDEAPWVKDFMAEITTFPAAANDDQVDGMTQALRHLFVRSGWSFFS